ncbi:MAG: tail fiber protein [Pseudomonadota bacterium]
MSEPFLGEIRMFGFNFPPRGWAECNGQLLQISQNQALFAILGTTYGGNGRTDYALPDMRGRAPRHAGTGAGLPTSSLGQRSGSETHTLSANEIPAHSHAVKVSSDNATSIDATGNLPAKVVPGFNVYGAPNNLVNMDAGSIPASGGGGQAHNNMQPYLVINFCIAIFGIFPSRN